MKNLMGLKGLVAVVGLTASSAALAGDVTGTANVTSEYVFRGVSSSNGAAVQGSLDYTHESGFYGSLWASNTAPFAFDGNELDLVLGWSGDLGNGITLDGGFINYFFSEDGQFNVAGVSENIDYWEVYGGIGFGPVSATLYYADDFFNTDGTVLSDGSTGDGSMFYLTADYTLAIKEDLDLTFQAGYNTGDGIEAFLTGVGSTDDNYIDYSIVLTKGLENGFAFSFGAVDTDIEASGPFALPGGGVLNDFEDEVKFFVSLSKEFDI